MNRFISLFFPLMLSFSVNSGVFGPDSFEECVLDKMEGTATDLRKMVNRACEKKFPYERAIGSEDIEFTWESIPGGFIEINLVNNSKYEVTKLTMKFSEFACKNITVKSDYQLIQNFYFSSSLTSSSSIKNAVDYECAVPKQFYGKFRR